MNSPEGLAADASGNLYIADDGNFRIRKVSPSGIINTVAGDGTSSYGGDGGPAAGAVFGIPWGVTVDGSGKIYIADSGNGLVRKVSNGIINTLAGGLSFPRGIAVDSTGNVYVTSQGANRVFRISPSGTVATVAGMGGSGYSGDGGPAVSAALNNPYGVAVDSSGNLYIADTNNRRIRKVSASGIITTIAGDRNRRLRRR